MGMKKIISVILINIMLVVFLGEVATKVFPNLFDTPPPYNTAKLDDELSWRQKEEVFAIDGFHWTETGHKVIRENLNNELIRMLK